jgi:hypothetical protein
VELAASAMAGGGVIDSTGTGDMTLAVSAPAGTGSLVVIASGGVLVL